MLTDTHLIRTWCVTALLAAAALLPACTREAADEVVLYSSVDPQYLQPVMDAFEEETGIRVRYAGDTEATKTTGLATRLVEENRSGRARADVWWSSEPFWTIQLAGQGIFTPYTSDAAEQSIPGGWPAQHRGDNDLWYGLALRARVFVYNTDLVSESDAPRTLTDLLDPRFKGRIGIARPEFGTTRGHMAAMLVAFGEDQFRDWLQSLADNGVRIYDGNMSVVRAVSTGEIHVGLTDTDDVWAGQRNGWPVALTYEARSNPPSLETGMGPLMMPNTIALVAGAPNSDNGKRFIDFVLSGKAERILAESDSHNIPVNPDLSAEFSQYAVADQAQVSLEAVAAAMDRAIQICNEILTSR